MEHRRGQGGIDGGDGLEQLGEVLHRACTAGGDHRHVDRFANQLQQFHVFAKGGREDTGMEAISWIKRCVANGAGEIVVNSIDTDGVKKGFDVELLQLVCEAVNVPVIASGGAGSVDHFTQLFQAIPTIDAALAASVFHFGQIRIPDLKRELQKNDIIVRL